MVASLAHYRDGLGFEVIDASPLVETAEGRFSHWMWLRCGAAELMLNTAYDSDERPTEREIARWRGHGDVALYLSCDDVDALHRELADRGIITEPPTNQRYGMRQLNITDPDGYTLCFQQPLTRT